MEISFAARNTRIIMNDSFYTLLIYRYPLTDADFLWLNVFHYHYDLGRLTRERGSDPLRYLSEQIPFVEGYFNERLFPLESDGG